MASLDFGCPHRSALAIPRRLGRHGTPHPHLDLDAKPNPNLNPNPPHPHLNPNPYHTDLPWLSRGAWDGTRRLTTKEQEWERDVAGIVMRAIRVGLMEPAMELMCKHSLLGPSIVKKLQVTEVPCNTSYFPQSTPTTTTIDMCYIYS